ncbi:hypothetical protein, partial [Pseudomonas viridiflava]|uniref:hypothetical protein n=1 Tax=Pseudomonas viridiflava TaxID=33069 RepID=UPI0019801B4B
VHNLPVDKKRFNTQLIRRRSPARARLLDNLLKRCTPRTKRLTECYPQKVGCVRVTAVSKKLYKKTSCFYNDTGFTARERNEVDRAPHIYRELIEVNAGWKLTYPLAFSRIAGLLK